MQLPDNGIPFLVAALVAFVIYRRIRRNIGRQRVTNGLFIRVGLFAVIGTLLLLLPSGYKGAQLVAVGAGAAVGLLGLRLASFETEDGRLFYTPNPYLGVALVALFLGRVTYRGLTMRGRLQELGEQGPGAASGVGSGMSITLVLLVGIVAYYLCFYSGILLHRHRRQPVQISSGPQ